MTSIELLNIIAIILSPIVAVLVSFWVGEKMRQRNYKEDRKDKILEKLIAFRHDVSSPNFLSAINSIILAFDDNDKIKELVRDLHRAYANKESQNIVDQKLVELIYAICKDRKYNITEHEIYNLFKPFVSQSVLKEVVQSSLSPSSTLGINAVASTAKVDSSTISSVTAGYLSNFNK